MEEVIIAPIIVLGLAWLVLHYITRWKTAPRLTDTDEALLEELYQLARRLEDRVDTVERLAAADDPNFRAPRLVADRETDNVKLDEIDRMLKERTTR